MKNTSSPLSVLYQRSQTVELVEGNKKEPVSARPANVKQLWGPRKGGMMHFYKSRLQESLTPISEQKQVIMEAWMAEKVTHSNSSS